MFNLATFLSGFAFWKGEKFGKILFYIIMWGLCATLTWTVYWKVFLKETQTNNTIAKDDSYAIQQPKFTTFGCSNIRVQENTSKSK